MKGNKQTTGLGRGVTTSNKVFIVDRSPNADADITSTLAQLAADKAAIDWSVNCGNMSAALPMYALDTGLFPPAKGKTVIRIYNTNTRVTTDGTVLTPDGTPYIPADAEIPGVMGRFPGVELSLRNPVGSKTGKLLPTGNVVDRCAGVDVSCVDVAMPVVVVRAADVGKTGQESVEELSRDTALKQRLREIWVEAGLRMGLKKKNGSLMTAEELANSETVPKICLVAPGSDGAQRDGTLFHAADAAQLARGDRRLLPRGRVPVARHGGAQRRKRIAAARRDGARNRRRDAQSRRRAARARDGSDERLRR